MTDAELAALVDEAIAATGATSARDLGKVMGWLSPRTRGRADGKVVSGLVAAALARTDLAAHDVGEPRRRRPGLGPAGIAMLSRRLDRVAAFTRRDAVRLAVAAALLITGLTAVLSIDDLPNAVNLWVGDLATADVLAPRTLAFQSEIETAAARQKARDDVPPQYDYKAEIRRGPDAPPAGCPGGAPRARRRGVRRPASRRRIAGLRWQRRSRRSRPTTRKTLEALAPERWTLTGAEATRVLGLVQRDPLRDAELETVRRNLGERFSAALTDDERALATGSWRPSWCRTRPTARRSRAARDAAEAAGADQSTRSSRVRSSSRPAGR